MGIAKALLIAGLAYVVIKQVRKKKAASKFKPVGYGGGGGMMGMPMGMMGGGGGGGYRAMLPAALGGGGGGQAASYFGGGGGKRELGGPGDGNGTRAMGDGGYSGNGALPPGPDFNKVMQTLFQCITEQRIQAFYPDQGAVGAIAERIVSTNAIPTISDDWNLTPDIAIDLCKLALFDIIVLCDDSASMRHEQNGERMEDLKETLAKVAQAATLFDDDGIEVRFFNSPIEGNRINSDDAAVNLVSQVMFDGPAMMGAALDHRVLQPLVLGPARQGYLRKPKLIIIITDGTGSQWAEAPGALQHAIGRAAHELSQTRYGADTLSIQFCQIGNDFAAQQWLSSLDADPVIGGLIDQTGDFDAESAEMMRKTGQQLSPVLWLLKMMLGGIDNSYDSKDE